MEEPMEGPQRPNVPPGYMSEDDQRSRRNSIKEIMQDDSLTPVEKRRSIQSLMDGRRRSSATGCSLSSDGNNSAGYACTMAAAARAATQYYDSSDDEMMDDGCGSDDEQDLAEGGYNPSPHSSISINSNNSNVQHAQQQTENFLATAGGQLARSGSIGGGGGEDDNATTISTLLERSPPDRRRVARSHSLQHYNENQMAVMSATATFFSKDPHSVNRRMEMSRPKCDHYERQCTLVSPCCGLAFACRICHDECPVLPPPLSMRPKENDVSTLTDTIMKKPKMERRRSLNIDLDEEETHHEIDRFAVKEVICRQCFTRQSSKTNNCINCNIQFGSYHCSICNLWMADKESPYHCEECGFCRVGGRENFRHCDDCGMCIDALLFDDHNCKLGKYMSNCPVCQEDLFSSRYASHEMPCGHAIHWHCFKELTSYDTRCPVCKKTAETADQMAPTWSAMAMGIALQPVPPELARMVSILCYDCEQHDDNRRWHFLGVRCMNCLSFNTTVERTIMTGREAASFLDELEGSRPDANNVDLGAMTQGNLSAMLMNAESLSADGMPANFGLLLQDTNFSESQEEDTTEAMDEDHTGGQDTSSGSTSSFPRR